MCTTGKHKKKGNDMNEFDEKRYYERDGSENKRVLKFFAILLIAGVVAWGISEWMKARHVPQLPGEVILKGRMSFEEVDGKVQEAGYVPLGKIYSDEKADYYSYESSDVLGYVTQGSLLTMRKTYGSYISFDHYISENSDQYNQDNPGEVFNTILKELTGQIGGAPKKTKSPDSTESWYWQLDEKTFVGIQYCADGMVMVRYIYYK